MTDATVVARVSLMLVLTGLVGVPSTAHAQVPDRALVVGIKDAPPFAIRQPDGTWTGISVDLWEEIAAELGYAFEWRETDLPGLLAGVEAGELDAGVAALTVTAEREIAMDFTHPFHVSGLGIAVPAGARRGWLAVLEQFFTFEFLRIVAGLAVLLFVVGWLVWLFERRGNPEQFGGPTAHGLGAGFWWSAVTMTTVGYGDKAPTTVGGRLVALLWMFTALIVISSFTASIAASLTVGSLVTGVSGPEDLSRVRVGTVAASTSAAYLDRVRLPYAASGTVAEALAGLTDGGVGAVVYDRPILQYAARQQYGDTVTVLPVELERQAYAIALPTGSALREPINRALLSRTADPAWERLLESYLGDDR